MTHICAHLHSNLNVCDYQRRRTDLLVVASPQLNKMFNNSPEIVGRPDEGMETTHEEA